jgi:methyl coenzyme M reductase subunit C-like uncharacterized protein (methanogenesis marker protein 7)
MTPNLKLLRHNHPDPEINTHEYQSRMGSVMYAMLGTRPDIGYAVTTLSQYSSNPGEEHWIAINRLLHYLNTTKDYKLVYNGNSNMMTTQDTPIQIGLETQETFAPCLASFLSWLVQPSAGVQRNKRQLHCLALKASTWL